ncbi:hypothetical protein Z967_11990 [Clostridium novyi A str. 4540]|uniref:hypothetical protein n=1 Tax=Clostridium novyi TaxID=1542 RepID=UPI0004D83844|nr:hypothetical protein [Clostridium novyi]KEH88977.1 hypothetical protein Z967_11990 [Clostridium novyi A str. 4540]
MEDFLEKYEYNCIKKYVKQGIVNFKKLKEIGIILSNTIDLNESDGAIIVFLDGDVFSVKLDDAKQNYEIASYIYTVYKDEKGNFYTRLSRENNNLNFASKFSDDAIFFNCAEKFKEIIY